MKLLVFAASHRVQSLNRMLVRIAANHAQTLGAAIDFAEFAEFDMPLYNDTLTPLPDSVSSFAQRIASADGMIISAPEYNWSMPAPLKNIIDWTSRIPGAPLAGKTALLMCATPGSRGGIIGLQHLKTSLEALQTMVYSKMFPLGAADSLLGEQAINDKKQQALLISLVTDYIHYTRKLTS